MAGGFRAGAVRVRVPATSANLGPGYDSFGLALARYDVVDIEISDSPGPVRIDVEGQGAAEVARDESHLVVRAMHVGLDSWFAGRKPAAMRLRCTNAIPHARGLGSSAAAIVAGLVAARALLPEPEQVSDDDVLALGSELEGHPDNVAACLSGGFVVSWCGADGARAVRVTPDARIRPVVCVPDWSMATHQARVLLPGTVTHADAAFTAARAALLVTAMSARPELLLVGTEDRLHQPYRSAAMAPSARLMTELRGAGVPAVFSGAGPTVLALTVQESGDPGGDPGGQVALVRAIAGAEWVVEELSVDSRGARAEYRGLGRRSGP